MKPSVHFPSSSETVGYFPASYNGMTVFVMSTASSRATTTWAVLAVFDSRMIRCISMT